MTEMSEGLKASVDVLKLIASEGIKAKYGTTKGESINFLLFGGYGVPGLVTDYELVLKASLTTDAAAVGQKFTEESASEFVQDVASTLLTYALDAAGIAIPNFLRFAGTFFTTLLEPTELGNGELPISLRPSLRPPKNKIPGVPTEPRDPDEPRPTGPRPPPPISPPPKPAPAPLPQPPIPEPAPEPEHPDRPRPSPRNPSPPANPEPNTPPPPKPTEPPINPPTPEPKPIPEPKPKPKPKPEPIPPPPEPDDNPPTQPPIPLPLGHSRGDEGPKNPDSLKELLMEMELRRSRE